MEDYIGKLKESFYQHAHPEKQAAMSNYMRSQFAFLGIQSQERRKLIQEHVKSHGRLSDRADGRDIVGRLWQEEEREYQYAAVDLIERGYLFQKEDLQLLEHMITHKSWWDTVDRIAPSLLPAYYRVHPEGKEQQLKLWARSDNLWLRRSAILFQLKFKGETNARLLFSLINENLSSDEFFIDKAIGWALREYSKTNADAVVEFIEATPGLAPLSRREGLKWLENKRK